MTTIFDDYEQEEGYYDYSDFHAVYTVTIGELIHEGLIDFTDGTWDAQPNGGIIDWYNDEQKERFWKKFEQHFYWREIGELPFKRWKWDLLARLAEVMPKYKFIYSILDGNIDPLQIENEYGKNRNIYSDFPQTMLSGNEDYASTGNDYEYERVKDGSIFEIVDYIKNNYIDPDLALLHEVDSMFYCLLTSNVNGY